MACISIHDERLERLSRQVLLRANLPGVVVGLFACVSIEVVVLLWSEGVGRWIAGAGLLLATLTLLAAIIIRIGMNRGNWHSHDSACSWATVVMLGTKGIKYKQISFPKKSTPEEIIDLTQPRSKRDIDHLAYDKVRQVWERDGVLFLIHGFLEQPIPLDGRGCDLDVARRLIGEHVRTAKWYR